MSTFYVRIKIAEDVNDEEVRLLKFHKLLPLLEQEHISIVTENGNVLTRQEFANHVDSFERVKGVESFYVP